MYCLELIEAFGTGIPRLINSYRTSGIMPSFEIGDHMFKITLPALDAIDTDPVIQFLKERTEFTRQDLQDRLGLTKSSAVSMLNSLTQTEKIMKMGKGPSTRYRSLV